MALMLFTSSCNSHQNPTPWLDFQSNIRGQLGYTVNPFDSKDSVLCLNNVYDISILTYSNEYYAYLKDLLSKYDVLIDEGDYPTVDTGNMHEARFIIYSEMTAYPVIDCNLISVVDKTTGIIPDSLSLRLNFSTVSGSETSTIKVIYLKKRQAGAGNSNGYYIDEYVAFHGNDFMNPPLITDSITSQKEQIICFDGHRGPIVWNKTEIETKPTRN